jgi:peptidyl-prolyl cis-trans isomerase B (cyclophilin B)
VLQCGDPTGLGTGGPGYRFPNEYPTNQYRMTDPALEAPVIYPRGTLAMANSGQGTNGSQFFVVYGDPPLPPTYTVFGTVDETGLATVDKIAAGGVQDGSYDGMPTTTATIKTLRLS